MKSTTDCKTCPGALTCLAGEVWKFFTCCRCLDVFYVTESARLEVNRNIFRIRCPVKHFANPETNLVCASCSSKKRKKT